MADGRRLEPDERREQILACAQRLFSSKRFESVSSAEIAREAGVSKALLNHYFGSKRELHLAVVRKMMDVPPVPVPEYVPGVSVEDRVAQSVEGWLELLSRNREIWLAATAITATGAEDRDLEAIVEESRGRAVDHIIAVCGLGPIAREHPEVRSVIRGFSGMAEATTREWLLHGRLNRKQARVLLERTLLSILAEIVGEVVAVGQQPEEETS